MARLGSDNPDDSSHQSSDYNMVNDTSYQRPKTFQDDYYQNTFTGKVLGSLLGYKKK